MNFQALLPALLVCLAAHAAGEPPQVSMFQAASRAPQSLTGCVDQQQGRYVLLDDKMVKIANLKSAGSDQEVFARRVGQQVLVKGIQASGKKDFFTVTSIEGLSDTCGPK